MDHRFNTMMSLSRDALDFQLSPSRSAKDAMGALTGMVRDTATARLGPQLRVTTDVTYGPRDRQKLDVYVPNQPPHRLRPAIIFLHGGFWQEGDKSVSGFAVQSWAAQGWATISVGYTLTPQVSLTQLNQEINEALRFINTNAAQWGIDANRLVLVGHSAGAHLAACVLCDLNNTGVGVGLTGAVLVSGVFDLAPIARSYVNDLAQITADEVALLSPLRHRPVHPTPLHVVVGADEPDAFQLQSKVLSDLWQRADAPLDHHLAKGRDHFDILDELKDPTSVTLRAMTDMIVRRR